jgi:hypothetical protein
MQGVIEPRIVERYEPIALPPPPVAPAPEGATSSAKADKAKKDSATPPKGGKED